MTSSARNEYSSMLASASTTAELIATLIITAQNARSSAASAARRLPIGDRQPIDQRAGHITNQREL